MRCEVIGFEAKRITLVDFVVGADARNARQAGTDYAFLLVVLEGLAANAIMADHKFAERSPALSPVKRQLHTEENVVLTRVGVEGGGRGHPVVRTGKGKGLESRK